MPRHTFTRRAQSWFFLLARPALFAYGQDIDGEDSRLVSTTYVPWLKHSEVVEDERAKAMFESKLHDKQGRLAEPPWPIHFLLGHGPGSMLVFIQQALFPVIDGEWVTSD